MNLLNLFTSIRAYRLFVACLVLVSCAETSSALDFSFRVTSEVGDRIGNGQSVEYTQDNATIPSYFASPDFFEIRPNTPNTSPWRVTFRGLVGGALRVGTYNMDTTVISDIPQPYLFVRKADSYSHEIQASFEIKKITYWAGGMSVWMTFTQKVDGSEAELRGEFKYDADSIYTPRNIAPALSIGKTRMTELGMPTAFSAFIVDDGLPGATTIRWSATPTTLVPHISAPTSETTLITFPAEGIYMITATISDGDLSTSSSVQVSVHRPLNNYILRFALPFSVYKTFNTQIYPAGVYTYTWKDRVIAAVLESYPNYPKIRVSAPDPDNGPEGAQFTFETRSGLAPAVGHYEVGLKSGDLSVSASLGQRVFQITRGTVDISKADFQLAPYYSTQVRTFHVKFHLFTDIDPNPIVGEVRYGIPLDEVDVEPIVTAGGDRIITALEPQMLLGNVLVGFSTIPPVVQWTKISGPGEVIFTEPNSPKCPVTFSEKGKYVFQLTVSHGQHTVADTVEITVVDRELSIATKSRIGAAWFVAPHYTITGRVSERTIQFFVLDQDQTRGFQFSAPVNATLLNGRYTVANGSPSSSGTTMTVDGRSVNHGAFQIRDLQVGADGELKSCVLTFQVSSYYYPYSSDSLTDGEIKFFAQPTPGEINRPPIVSFGFVVFTDSTDITLSPIIVDDLKPYGSKLSYEWEFVAGPSAVIFNDTTVATPRATFADGGLYRLRLRVSDGELQTTRDVLVAVKVTPRHYEGLAKVDGVPVGIVRISCTPMNRFTAVIKLGREVIRLKGDISAHWSDSGYLLGGGSYYVSFDRYAGDQELTAIIRLESLYIHIICSQTYKSFYEATSLKFGPQGRYTVALNSNPSHVTGAGFGELKVQPNGTYRLRGCLADGVPYSASGSFDLNNGMSLYLSLREDREQLSGSCYFNHENPPKLSGDLVWYRQESDEAMYPGGLATNVRATGMAYVSPRGKETVFLTTTPTSGELMFFDDTLLDPIYTSVDFKGAATIVDAKPHGVRLYMDRRTGLFRGKFQHPKTQKSFPFRGVILQGMDSAFGYINFGDHSGGVSLTLSPN